MSLHWVWLNCRNAGWHAVTKAAGLVGATCSVAISRQPSSTNREEGPLADLSSHLVGRPAVLSGSSMKSPGYIDQIYSLTLGHHLEIFIIGTEHTSRVNCQSAKGNLFVYPNKTKYTLKLEWSRDISLMKKSFL